MKRSFVKHVASFFAFFCIAFIPFPFYLTKIQLQITDLVFGKLIGAVSGNIFNIPLSDRHVHSDTVSMYILVLLLFILSVLISLLVFQIKKWAAYKDKIFAFFYLLFCYYLALQLLKYGADKIFKNQFYIPEPNTLYTPMGRMSKGLLYWSSIGTSHFYTVFLGCMEALAAILILISRTRVMGLLMSFVIILNTVAINFGFDISVKIFSLLLLFLTVYLLIPYIKNLYRFFLPGKMLTTPVVNKVVFSRNTFLSVSMKCLLTGIIFVEAFYPFIKTGVFNGDMAQRPYLHGAYEVKQMIAGTDTLSANNLSVKRFFIHRQGYLIFQDQQDNMADYKLKYDADKHIYILIDYKMNRTPISFYFNDADSILMMKYLKGDKEYQLTGKALDWKKLPAVQKSFHWTVD